MQIEATGAKQQKILYFDNKPKIQKDLAIVDRKVSPAKGCSKCSWIRAKTSEDCFARRTLYPVVQFRRRKI